MTQHKDLALPYESWKTDADGKPKIKVVLSDLHLAAGLFWGGERNPHEDFFFDEELSELIEYFSTGKYGGDFDVELILNGDIFDFLNVPYKGDFPEAVTEDLSVWKLKKCLKGHPRVVESLRVFLKHPNKRITYQIGNHDQDFFFHKVRTVFQEALCEDPERVQFIYKKSYYVVDGNVEIHHGHQFEAVHYFNYKIPLLTKGLSEPILNLPWGSLFVMKIVNRLKRERDYLDKVRPVKLYLLYGMFTDPVFTFKYLALTFLYFLKTRFIYDPRRRSSLKTTLRILREELKLWDDGEDYALSRLRSKPDVQAVIMGHTHVPRYMVYGDGRIYVNTGTWTKMINLDLRRFGASLKKPFCLIEYDGLGGRPQISLHEWLGRYAPHQHYVG